MSNKKVFIEKSVYQALLDVYTEVLNNCEKDKRELAIIYLSDAIKNIALVFEILNLNTEDIRKLVYTLKMLK